jgi:eukaryotic-like serine/threonine-protein kinase
MDNHQDREHGDAAIPRTEILEHLERILSSPGFSGADRTSRFLRYVVEETLEGKGDQLKEYAIATEAFGLHESFDPHFHSLIRVEAHRLRRKLRDYYEGEGIPDTIRIDIPKGHYAAEFLRPRAWPTGQTSSRGTGRWLAKRGWRWALTVALAVASLVVAGIVAIRRSAPPRTLRQSDVVVIAEFENSTGDPVFDDTLKEAATIQLTQSPYVDVLPEARARSTLKLMMKPIDTKMTRDVAMEVCLRTGSRAVIEGSIALIGRQYVLSLRAIDCQTGSALAQEQATVSAKEQVIGALGQEASDLRHKLGESLTSVRSYDVPLAEATTPSLDALKAFTVGLAKGKTNDADATPFLRHAIELDPHFASAFESLGAAYYNLGETGLAQENFTQAFLLRDRVSERERFAITARYYDYVTGDLEKATEVYLLWEQAYPRSGVAQENLGEVYVVTGQFEKALAETLVALEMDPRYGSNYSNLLWCYTALNRFTDATSLYEKAVAEGIDDPVMHVNRFGVAFLQGDTAEMDRQMNWSAGQPQGEDLFLSAKSDTEAFFGRLATAREFSRQAVASAVRSGEIETAALWEMDEAIREAELGNSKEARETAKASLQLSSNYDTQILAALVFARAGDSARAESLARDLSRRHPADTLVNFYWLPVIRASIALEHNNPGRAIEILRATDPYEFATPGSWPAMGGPLYPCYLRGVAFLRLGRGRDAAAEFQKIIDHRGFAKASPLASLARLDLARAYVLDGDWVQGLATYGDLLKIWHDADPDLSPRREAKDEYARLRMRHAATE